MGIPLLNRVKPLPLWWCHKKVLAFKKLVSHKCLKCLKYIKVPKVKECCHFYIFLKSSMYDRGKLSVTLEYQLARRRRTTTLGILGTLAHFRNSKGKILPKNALMPACLLEIH